MNNIPMDAKCANCGKEYSYHSVYNHNCPNLEKLEAPTYAETVFTPMPSKEEREKILDKMVEQNQKDGLYEQTQPIKDIMDNGRVIIEPLEESAWNVPRRAQLDKYTDAELAIYNAIIEVEKAGADVRLTKAVILLGQAKDAVADYVDGISEKPKEIKTPRQIIEELYTMREHHNGVTIYVFAYPLIEKMIETYHEQFK